MKYLMTLRRLATLFVAFLLLVPACAHAKDTLRIIAWSGYADRDWVVQFEKTFNANVEVTIIDTDDALWEKVNKYNGQSYDLIAINTAELQRYIDNNLVSPIDLARIPNVKNQLPRFQALAKAPGIMRNNHSYAVPFTYSEMGLIYDRRQLKQAPTSMAEMWEPKYKGKILLHDGSVHNFSFTALVLGIQNPFKLSDTQLVQVTDKLIELRKNEPVFYVSPEDGTKEFVENKMALMFGNFGNQQVKKLRDAGADVGYVIPKEGALAWLDCWAISRAAKNRNLAEKWIDFTLSKPISNALTQRQDLANTLTKFDIKESDKILWLEPVENSDNRTLQWERIRQYKARTKKF